MNKLSMQHGVGKGPMILSNAQQFTGAGASKTKSIVMIPPFIKYRIHRAFVHWKADEDIAGDVTSAAIRWIGYNPAYGSNNGNAFGTQSISLMDGWNNGNNLGEEIYVSHYRKGKSFRWSDGSTEPVFSDSYMFNAWRPAYSLLTMDDEAYAGARNIMPICEYTYNVTSGDVTYLNACLVVSGLDEEDI